MTGKICQLLHWQNREYYGSLKNPEYIFIIVFFTICQTCLSDWYAWLVTGCCDPSAYMPLASCLTGTNLRSLCPKNTHLVVNKYLFTEMCACVCSKCLTYNSAKKRKKNFKRPLGEWETRIWVFILTPCSICF